MSDKSVEEEFQAIDLDDKNNAQDNAESVSVEGFQPQEKHNETENSDQLGDIQRELQLYIDQEGPIIRTESDSSPIKSLVNEEVVVEEHESEGNDDFDDFNEANDDADSDFGSFDDASFDNASFDEKPHAPQNINDIISFDEYVFNDEQVFTSKLEQVMQTLFPIASREETNQIPTIQEPQTVLSDRSQEIFAELATIPHLKPPNWIKSKIRHNLLIKLGIPINLDEISEKETSTKHIKESSNHFLEVKGHSRKKSISIEDINWDNFDIPDISELNISNDEKLRLLSSTSEFISQVETDNLNNSARQYLENASDTALDSKLQQFQSNYDQLIKLSSVWNSHLQDLKNNFEIYESVVQNLIGYSQKLRRDEILEHLKKVKHKGKKSQKRLW